MVKRSAHFPAVLAAACVLAVSGCAVRGPFVHVAVESLVVSSGAAAPFLSLGHSPGALFAVFADRATTTLDMIQLSDDARLPSSAPAAEVIDKVDMVAPLSSTFGENLLCVGGGKAAVLYLDRESDVKNVLKLATRRVGEKQWSLDVLEPAGDPLVVSFHGAPGFEAAWSSGLLSYHSPDNRTIVGPAPIPFKALGRGSPDGSGGFTAFDALSSQLFALRWTGSDFSAQVIPGGSSVHASLRSASGRLRVLTWDVAQRRLLLHQEGAPGTFATATVTVCDGTGTVALLPAQSDSTFLMLFDEVRSLGGGRTVSQVSLIGPGSVLGARGSRYRKAILASGESRIDGFAAVRTSDALYVLVSQGSVKILRVPLFP